MSKTAIVYYSMSGNTEYVADYIAKKTGADLIKIAPVKAYPDSGASKFIWGGKSAVMKETPKLLPYEFNAADYDMIIFGFPVWASNFTPPIRTFIKENKEGISGKKIAAFTCFSGGGADKALKKLRDFLDIDSFTAELILIDPKDKPLQDNEEKMNKFCEKVGA